MTLNHTPSPAARQAANATRRLEDWVETVLRSEYQQKAEAFRRGLTRDVPQPVVRPRLGKVG